MNFVNDSIINAVSWTLVHSLWLGLVLALLAGLTVLLTKKATSVVRYNTLALLSILFIITIGFVFSNELNLQETEIASQQALTSLHEVQSANIVSTADIDQETNSTVSGFITEHASWIVWIWFLIFVFKCFRMTNGLRQIYIVRNYHTVSPSEKWQERLSELKSLLRISQTVQLMESKLVKVPSVTGFFKPMILVPVGLLNNLPQEQVEAILLHELAHIRRSDYAINLVQSFLEIVFFFNPGVLWISSLLKEERENCCDDLAISVTQDKKEFVHALVSFQEYNLSGQNLAMQFGDQKMNLADRAKRILFNHNKMLSKVEKGFLSICIALGIVLCIAFANMSPTYSQAQAHDKLSNLGLVSDSLYVNRKYNPKSIPEGTSLCYADVIDGKEYVSYIFKHKGMLYQVAHDMSTCMVNGKLVTGDERKKHMPVINELIRKYQEEISESDRIEAEAALTEAEATEIEAEASEIEAEARIIEAESREIEKEARIIEAESREIEKESRKIEKESRRVEKETRRVEIETTKVDAQTRRIEAQSKRIELQAQGKKAFAEARQGEIEACQPVATNRVMVETTKQNNNSEDLTEKIIKELKKNGFKSEIHSFELSEKKLLVNGKKQSDETFDKLKKYTQPGMKIMYKIEVH